MNEIVTISQGQLKGEPSVDGEVTAFRGIPFASPPVGDLRWRVSAASGCLERGERRHAREAHCDSTIDVR